MKRKGRLVAVVLLLSAVCHALNYSALVGQPSVVGTGQPPVAGRRPPIGDEILMRIADEKAEPLHRSSEARRDLAVIVQAVIGRRISSNFLGYEQNKEYLGDLEKVYDGFSLALKVGMESRVSAFEAQDFQSATSLSLSQNEAEFQRFYSIVVTKDPVLQGKSPSEIKEAMILFSAVIYSSDYQLWKVASDRSYFWPACRKRSG